jgi:hypothetical protein
MRDPPVPFSRKEAFVSRFISATPICARPVYHRENELNRLPHPSQTAERMRDPAVTCREATLECGSLLPPSDRQVLHGKRLKMEAPTKALKARRRQAAALHGPRNAGCTVRGARQLGGWRHPRIHTLKIKLCGARPQAGADPEISGCNAVGKMI